jgi:HK97 gp10 family phage protein
VLDVASGIRLNLKGFSKMLDEIQQAGGNVESATEEALRKCAGVVENELRNACNQNNVPGSISSEIRTEVDWIGNRCSATVGWELGSYNPKNISTGYKAVFLNYGTPKRTVSKDGIRIMLGGDWVTEGKNRGAIAPRNFIQTAKEASAKQVKKIQKDTLDDILKELSG